MGWKMQYSARSGVIHLTLLYSMKNFILPFILLLPVFCSGSLFGQGKYDEAIYRGPVALSYPFEVYRGTCYAFDKQFEKSDVEYNRKWYHDVDLNLDACRDELCLSMDGGIIIVLSKELVGRFRFGGRNFICRGNDVEGLEPGYYQVLYDGRDKVYKKIVKKYNKIDGITQEFFPIIKYYLVKDARATRIKGDDTFGKVYRPMRKEIRRVASTASKAGLQGEDLYVAIMNFIEKEK